MAKRLNADAIVNKVIPVDLIDPHESNYNQHPDEQISQLAISHTEFGQYRSVVVVARPGGRYTQVAGHGYLQAAKGEGLKEVRCDVLPVDTPAETVKAILVADNLHAQQSSPDDTILTQLLQEQVDAGFDLAALGTDEETLRQMLDALGDGYLSGDGEVGDGGDEFDTTPEEGPTRTHVGELWQLGEHRLLVGDCTDPQQLNRLMQGDKCKLIFTDPPYGISYSGRGASTSQQTIENDDLDPAALYAFLLKAFRAFPCDAGCNIYICHNDTKPRLRPAFENALLDAGYNFGTTIIWVKQAPSMGWQDYRGQHEPILFGWSKGEGRVRVEDRSLTTVWEVSRDAASSYQHPTQKPIELPSIAIRNSSNRGDIVFDGFGGSGSTLIACQREGRKACTCELDPKYADVILRRFEAETNQTAQLISRIEEVAHA